MKKLLVSLAALAAAAAAPAQAAVNITVEGGGTPIVYQDSVTGNRFAVLGLDSRGADADNIVNLPNTLVDNAYILSFINSGASQFVRAYYGPDFADVSLRGTPLGSINVADESRLFNSLLVEFTGSGNIVFGRAFGRGTNTLSLNVTQQGAPPVSAAVPEPSTWLMLFVGFFAMGFAMRRRKAGARMVPAHA